MKDRPCRSIDGRGKIDGRVPPYKRDMRRIGSLVVVVVVVIIIRFT
jgi:hypothetical protein